MRFRSGASSLQLPDWRGQIVVIVASGPSAKDVDLSLAQGRAKIIAVNESWRLCNADILFGCDGPWWAFNGGMHGFQGQRVTASHRIARTFEGIIRARLPGNNSGAQAIHLAERVGSRKIVLVGFDFHCDRGVHWHGRHSDIPVIVRGEPARLRNPGPDKMEKWRIELEAMGPGFARRGVDVINTNPGSAISAFRFLSFERALIDGGQNAHRADIERYRSADQ
jgi:hypothetical protein